MNQVSRTLDRPDSPTGRGIWLSILRNYLLWSTVAHLVWEVAQLPLYTIWTEASLAENAFAVVHCTGGDLIIAGAALAFGLVLAGSSNWPVERFWPVAALATAVGVGYTTYSEWLNTGVRATWTYADAMPVLPWLGTGLSPLLQWLLLPPLGLWICWRRGVQLPRRIAAVASRTDGEHHSG